MADFGMDENGLKVKRLPDSLAELQQSYRDIFGNDVNLDPQSTQGQEVAIWANNDSLIWELVELVYNAFDPNSAVGIQLDRLMALNGLKRKQSSFSTVLMTITGTPGTTIPSGARVSSVDGTIFETLVPFDINIFGINEEIFVSIVIGEVTAAAGVLTIIETPQNGWTGAINLFDASIGQDREKDGAARLRRAQSTALAATNIIDSLYAALSQINGVNDSLIFSNEEDFTSPEGVPAHRFMAIVDGGADADIAEAIYLNHTTGDKSYGAVSVFIENSRGQEVAVRFERPIDIDIWVTVDITTNIAFPPDGADQIKQAIVDYGRGEFDVDNCDDGFKISEDVLYTRLFTPINSICGHDVVLLFLGTAPAPAGIANIPITFNEISRWDVSRIVVNIVP